MLRALSLFSLLAAAHGCRATPVEVSPSTTPRAESRATEMPESLRCRAADDCTPEPSCYWSEPKCVAVASAVAPQCDSDADPPDASRARVVCGCQAGQCVPLAANK